jgi:hypothetical protein
VSCHQHAAGLERDLDVAAAVLEPGEERVRGRVLLVVLRAAKHVLEKQAKHPGHADQPLAGEGLQVDDAQAPVGCLQLATAWVFSMTAFCILINENAI